MRTAYQDYQTKVELEGKKIVVAHFGEFSLDFISGLTDRIENLMISLGDNKVVINKMYSILIEGMQNVRNHGKRDERKRQLAYLIISEAKDCFTINISNIVHIDDYENLIGYIEKINSYSCDELKEKYQNALNKEFLSHEGKTGLGLILTRLKTNRELSFEQKILSDDCSVFSFVVKLPRKINVPA